MHHSVHGAHARSTAANKQTNPALPRGALPARGAVCVCGGSCSAALWPLLCTPQEVNVSAAAGFFIYVRFMKYIKVRSALARASRSGGWQHRAHAHPSALARHPRTHTGRRMHTNACAHHQVLRSKAARLEDVAGRAAHGPAISSAWACGRRPGRVRLHLHDCVRVLLWLNSLCVCGGASTPSPDTRRSQGCVELLAQIVELHFRSVLCAAALRRPSTSCSGLTCMRVAQSLRRLSRSCRQPRPSSRAFTHVCAYTCASMYICASGTT